MRKKKGFEASQESVLDMWRCGSCPVDCGVLLVGCCSIRAGNHQACRLHCTTACMSLPGNGSHAFAARPCSHARACYQNKPDGSPQPSRWPVCDRDDWSRKRTGRQIRRGSELHMHACMQPPRGEQRTTTTERAGRRAGGHGRTPGDRRGSQQYQYFTAASYAYDHGAGPWMQWTGHRTAMHHACMAQWCSRLPVYHGNSDTMMAGRGYVRCLHTRTRGGRGAGSGRVIRATFPYAQRRQAGQRRQAAQAAPAGDLIDVIRSAPLPPGPGPPLYPGRRTEHERRKCGRPSSRSSHVPFSLALVSDD
jgi:hypothetical protein